MKLSDVLASYVADLGVCDPRYAPMVHHLRKAVAAAEACEWIASQPMIGPAANWWDLRAKAREALGLPPVMLSPEEKGPPREISSSPVVDAPDGSVPDVASAFHLGPPRCEGCED